MKKFNPENVGIITCDARVNILASTLRDLKEKTSFRPTIFNETYQSAYCHKGLNERAVFKWAVQTIGKDDWFLRLEDDVCVHPDSESIINHLIQFKDVAVFSLGNVDTPFSEEIYRENFVFRKTISPRRGLQALLIRGDFLAEISRQNLDKPSEVGIFHDVKYGDAQLLQLVDPILFTHKPVNSICWKQRTNPLPTISNSMSPHSRIKILLSKPIPVTRFGKNGLEHTEDKEFSIQNIYDYPEESRLIVELNGIPPVVFFGEEYPKKATIRTLVRMIKAKLEGYA